MSTDEEESCSDCKMELIERKWTQLLLNWINKCGNLKLRYQQLEVKAIKEMMLKYLDDISIDGLDRVLLAKDDLEPFIKYKYPILRLRYLCEDKDLPKKLYIMTSILLFHSCANSQTGAVDTDICRKMSPRDQEWLLKFCENLGEVEITVCNVEGAIRESYEFVTSVLKQTSTNVITRPALVPEKGIQTPESVQTLTETGQSPKNNTVLKFKSSVTVMPSVMTDTSSYSESSDYACKGDNSADVTDDVTIFNLKNIQNEDSFYTRAIAADMAEGLPKDSSRCKPGCACSRCSDSGPCCGDPGSSLEQCKVVFRQEAARGELNVPVGVKIRRNNTWYGVPINWQVCCVVLLVIILVFFIIVLITWPFTSKKKLHHRCEGKRFAEVNKKLVALSTKKLEYKFLSVPSETVSDHLAEAFKLFLGDLVRLERIDNQSRNNSNDLEIKKMNIQIDVETDIDPRIRLDTDESYTIKVETQPRQVLIKITSSSFAGVRHGLQTLSQMILLDQGTGSLITLTNSLVKDAPSYKYRGLMVDTARNYIPIPDLLRTIDAMATCKLNTFHWRITDVASFPLFFKDYPQLFEYGAYDRSLKYTDEHVKLVVRRASIRGIRVVIEVAAPGPVGRAWSWSPDTKCVKMNDNFTCDNILCSRLKMHNSVFDVLQAIYARIIDWTKVEDVFHLSNGVFSLSNCYFLLEDREGFLDKALERLKFANKGFLPKLPIIWYSMQLDEDHEARTWDKLGVQMNEWIQSPGHQYLSRFKVIHSSRWDLSCTIKKQRCVKYRTWQEMYAWKSWRNIEVFTIEGGEAMLWSDLVDSGNLDYHLWPRVAAVAERLWSDITTNATANGYTYARLDAHRWRMVLQGIQVQPVWPVFCSFNPLACISKLK